MTAFRQFDAVAERVTLAAERLRALCAVLRGARVGHGTRIGARIRIDRPWSVETGVRCQLESDVWLKIVDDAARIVLGDFVFLGRGVEIDVASRVTIGAHTLLAPGVFITDHSHRIATGARIDEQGCDTKEVRIGSDVWLGARAIVLPGVTIGDGAVVGAGAVVNRDVDANEIVAGVPARRIGVRGSRNAHLESVS